METTMMIIRSVNKLMAIKGIKNPTQLADKMVESGFPYTQASLSRLLAGKFKTISLDTVIHFAKYFNVTVGQIVGLEPLALNKWDLVSHDEFKRQVDLIYPSLNAENRDALAKHANLLLTAQDKESISIATPFPAAEKQ